jgi:MFS family permease
VSSARRVLVDITPLRRSANYRRLWSGYLVSVFGNQITVVAVPYQVYHLTRSTLDVGLVSLAQLGPLLFGSLGGGTLADRVDRRRLLIATQTLFALSSMTLAVNATFTHPQLWVIFVASACSAGLSGIDNPTRAAMIADFVDRDELAAASALWQLLFGASAVVGPAIGGLLIAHFGTEGAYLADVGTFAFSLAAVMRLAMPARPLQARQFAPREVLDGLRYLRGHQVLQGVFLIDINAMVFGMPRALFPALAIHRFHGGAGTVGLLYAAPAAGAFLGAALTGWVSSIRRQGLAVLIAVTVWGLAVCGFGLTTELAAAFVVLMIAGAADIISAVFRGAILQYEAPRELSGRLQAVQTAVVTGGPRLGDLEAGAVASAFGAVDSVLIGGAVCLVGVGVLMQLLPRFSRYRPRRPDEAQVARGDDTED